MPDLSTYLTAVIVGFVGLQLTRAARHTWVHDRPEYRRVLDRMSWWMLPASLVHLAVVVTAYRLLDQISWLSWGWYTLLTGTDGNALLGQTTQPGVGWTVTAFAIPLLLVPLMPRLALAEEHAFRLGNEHRTRTGRTVRVVQFGLVHCLVGVPLSAGLALTISGLYYDTVYQRTYTAAAATQPPIPLPVSLIQPQADTRADVDPDTRYARLPHQVAAYTAAAAHTITNWVVLAALLTGLMALELLR